MKLEIDELKMGQRLLQKQINDNMREQHKESTDPTSTEIQVEGKEGSDSNPPGTSPASNCEAPKVPTNTNEYIDMPHRSVTLTRGENGLLGFKQSFTCVHSVTSGSSADLKGLRRGDQLISVDGVKREGWTKAFMDTIKSRDTITLEVRYNPKQLEAEEREGITYFILVCIVVLFFVVFITSLFF